MISKRFFPQNHRTTVGAALAGLILAVALAISGPRALAAGLSDQFEVIQTRRGHETYPLDVVKPEQWQQVMHAFERGLDAVIHTVGDFHHEPLESCEPDQWRAVMASNLDSAFYAYRFAHQALRRRRGRLIYFSLAGLTSHRAEPNLAVYAAAKSGLASLAASIARIEAPHGVTCNVIAPGLLHDATVEEVERYRVPKGRTANEDELVATVAYLLDSSADQVTGTTLALSGGWRL